MRRVVSLLTVALLIASHALALGQEQAPKPDKKLPDGVYAVLRDGDAEKDVLPLKDKEALAVDRHRYLKKAEQEPPRYLVVRSEPDVELGLVGEPKAVKEGDEVVRILLKLQPKAATALERLTTDHKGKQVAIVVGGEVVTVHKIRDVIKGGDVQITSCAPGAATYLLEQLRVHQEKK
jgi:preprotein translocase subunit SecD